MIMIMIIIIIITTVVVFVTFTFIFLIVVVVVVFLKSTKLPVQFNDVKCCYYESKTKKLPGSISVFKYHLQVFQYTGCLSLFSIGPK